MADMRKVDEGNEVREKVKLDADPINETSNQTVESDKIASESNKRQKLENGLENEPNSNYFYINGQIEKEKDSTEGYEADERGQMSDIEARTTKRGPTYSTVEKGKSILIEEPESTFYISRQVEEENDDIDGSKADEGCHREELKKPTCDIKGSNADGKGQRGECLLIEGSDREEDYGSSSSDGEDWDDLYNTSDLSSSDSSDDSDSSDGSG
ncbi:hypothetical protein ACS0TY_004781 [Phlomoides rotata]